MEISELKAGAIIKILDSGKVVDEAIVCAVYDEAEPPRITIKSLRLWPGETDEFGLVQETDQWNFLFKGLADEWCFNPKSPTYTFEPA